ncbi:MAG TPA: Arm DNA-binding domain-containing protein [Edaphocola sp.]|nr:Arm DNA-binding domain-containing protein [Edaphocola sp.]
MSVFYNKKTKKWGFRAYLYDKEQGRKRQFTKTTFLTKAEATHAEALFIANHDEEQIRSITFQEALEKAFKLLNKRVKSIK